MFLPGIRRFYEKRDLLTWQKLTSWKIDNKNCFSRCIYFMSTIKYFAQVWRFLLTTHYFHIQPTVAFIKMIPKGLTRYPFESSQKSCWKMTAIPKQQFRSKIKFEREKKESAEQMSYHMHNRIYFIHNGECSEWPNSGAVFNGK